TWVGCRDHGATAEAQRAYRLLRGKGYAVARDDAAAALAALPIEAGADLTIADLVARWLAFCESYYQHADGSDTTETDQCLRASRPLLELFADEPARQFGPKKLRAVRERMIAGDPKLPADRRRGWCRTQANAAVARIRRLFRWGAAEELVPASVHAALCTLPALKRGRTPARESEPTKPVSDADVEKTLRELPPMVADMVRLQHLVGMRPCELCRMTTAEVDRTEELHAGVWVFRPAVSKLSYRGRQVEYPLGPRAVEIVKRYLRADPHAPLFSPAASEAIRHAEMRAHRRTKVQPSQQDRRARSPRRPPGDRYDTRSYGHAIRYASKRAGVPKWGPHALRRAVATRVRAQFGIEAARVMLAHQTGAMAELYAHRDLKSAAEIAAKIG